MHGERSEVPHRIRDPDLSKTASVPNNLGSPGYPTPPSPQEILMQIDPKPVPLQIRLVGALPVLAGDCNIC
jgi:hypothetical protein